MLLSIDVGIRNLAMCLIDESSKHICHWEVDGVPPNHEDGLWLSLTKHLHNRPWLDDAHKVIIERQPDRNKIMKQVERFLHGFFAAKGAEVQLWDAKHKIPDICGSGKRQYTKRKNAAIERCRAFVQETNANWLDTFEQHCKKDDMADTVMQALSFLNRIPTATETKKKSTEPKKQRPRKPTMNQKETRYSKANLAWLYVHDQMDKRFHKDLGRYYHTLQEMKNDFQLE